MEIEVIGRDAPAPVSRRTKRVGAYCRVSTDLETQQLSLESQMVSFRKKIETTPGWKLVGIYADEGITGTSARKRDQFNRMIKDAMEGRIDTILTKSISRFARNTVDCLGTVRDLRDKGVNVYFEKENLDTANLASEMILTVYAAFAQEESRSISENLKWGIRKRYERGEGRWVATYGYRKGDDGEMVIEPDEAKTVRRIYDLYRHGVGIPAISDRLNEENIPAPRGSNWSATTVQWILRSEKYVGDKLLQKYVTINPLEHKSVRNVEGKLPENAERVRSFYVRNSHVPIIDRRMHEQVQRIMELKAPRGEVCRYPYVDTEIICPFCGKPMIPRMMHVQKEKKAVGCYGDEGCHGFSVKTWMLDAVILAAFEEVNVEDIPTNGENAKMMKSLKAEGTPETVEYYLLNDAVKKITFDGKEGVRMQNHHKGPATEEKIYDWEVTVHWKCGLTTTIPLPTDSRYTEEPTHVAELYRGYLERVQSGEYVPACPHNLFEKKLKAQQTVRRI